MKIFILILILSIGVFAQTTTKELDKKLTEIQAASDLPGFAVGVVNGKGVLYQKGFGFADVEKKIPYTTETAQPIGSVSKTFVGVALMKAIDAGELDLETKINDVLPFKVYNPNFPAEEIKIKHLVTHTSGIIDREVIYEKSYVKRKRSDVALGEYLKDYLTAKGKYYSKENFTKEKPGANYQYSNIASALAAFVLESKTGVEFAEYTRKNIFEPLKMQNTSWFYEDVKKHATLYDQKGKPHEIYSLTTYPDGGLRSSVADLNKYMIAMIQGLEGDSKLLSDKAFEEMFSGKFGVVNPPKNTDLSRSNKGVFWSTRPSGVIGHNGSDPGVSAYFYFNRKTKVGRIVIINTDIIGDEKLSDQFVEIWRTVSKFANS